MQQQMKKLQDDLEEQQRDNDELQFDYERANKEVLYDCFVPLYCTRFATGWAKKPHPILFTLVVFITTSTSVFGNGRISTHSDRAYTSRCGVTNWNIHRPSRAGRFVRFGAFGEAKFPKMGGSLP